MLEGDFYFVEKLVKNLKLFTVLIFVITALSISTFAQTSDGDGDNVKDSDDLCPATKGTVANKGCPEKKKSAPQTTNSKNVGSSISEADLLKLQISAMDEIEAKLNNYKKLLAENKSNSTPKLKKENLELRKYEMSEIYRIASHINTNFGNRLPATGKAYFSAKIQESENNLKMITTQLKLAEMEENDTGNPSGGSFLDKGVTASKTEKTQKDFSNQNNEGKELYEAILISDNKKALELIKSGINLNYQKPDDVCTLSLAIRKRNTEMAKTLLEAGANPNFIETGGGSPLQIAVQMSDQEIVELLIKKYKVNVNTKEKGYTVVHTAVDFNSHTAILKLLLNAGANPNIIDQNGNSALNVAQAKNNPDKPMIALLLAASNAQIIADYKKKETANAAAAAAEKKDYDSTAKRTAALREYNRVHPEIERYTRRYAALLEKYRKAGEAQFLYKGTAADIINTKRMALETIKIFMDKHGKFLPQDLKEHLQEDAAKFVDGPNY